MRRDPKQHYIDEYMKSVRVKRIFPLLFHYKCNKCGMEYIREPMYEGSELDCVGEKEYIRGCSHCFYSKDQFRTWAQDNGYLYTEEFLSERMDKMFNVFF